MLRILGLAAITAILLLGVSANAWADEYGERFYAETPRGMADFTVPEETGDIALDDMAADLQDIMPAAGEEATEEAIVDEQEQVTQEPAEETEE